MSCHNIFFKGSTDNLLNQHGGLSSTLSLMGSNLISLTTTKLQTKERTNHCLTKALKTAPASDGGVQPTLKIHPLSASSGMYTGLSLTVSQGWCRISSNCSAATNHCLFRGQRPCFGTTYFCKRIPFLF